MNRLLTFVIFIALPSLGFGKQNIDLSFPDSLKEKADVVILFDNMEYERKSKTVLVEKNKMAFTILNSRAKGFEHMVVNYDDLSEIKSIACTIYDKHGQQCKKIKKGDIQDISYYSDYTLYSDNRVKVISALHHTYPYTIVFEYEKVYDGFFVMAPWRPIPSYRVATKSSSLIIKTPKDLPFVYNERCKDLLKTEESSEEDIITRSWSMKNFKALQSEHYSPGLGGTLPKVYFAPKTFEYDGFAGSNESWAHLGAFCQSLLHDENELTDKTKTELDNIKAKATSHEELTRLVYEYMQSKTRYVGIQLGIGGWQPFPSLTVDETGYGDCKALSYYTQTMLDYVGIESIYTIIGSGSRKIKYDNFPANQTNHAILCVPSERDTFWLECTSQTAPFNYLSTSCTNRKALLVKKDGSELCYIPQTDTNARVRESKMEIQADGRLYCENVSTYKGSFFDENYHLAYKSAKELNEYLQKSTPVSGISIEACSTELDKEDIQIKVNNSFYASDIASQAGNRLFVDLSPFAQIASIKKQSSERHNKVVLSKNKSYTDRITLNIPEGYLIEFLPENKIDSSAYGDYSFSVNKGEGIVTVERTFTINAGHYPKENYDEFIAFFNRVARMDNCKVCFKKI